MSQYPQLNRALIIPVIALVALLLKQVAHIELLQTQMDVIVDGILAVVALVGIFMHPHWPPAPTPVPPTDPPASVLPPSDSSGL